MKKLLLTKREFLMIFVGATLLALGINWFTSPAGLVTGGISGVAIIVQELSSKLLGFAIPLWMTNYVLNIPLFIISIKQRGFGFAKKSLWAVTMVSFALWYTEFLPKIMNPEGDLLLTAVFGGAIIGTGVGIVIKAGATTGGTDMLAAIIRYISPKMPIAKIMMMIDVVIILSGWFVFGSMKAMYAMIALVISTKVITMVLEGMHYARAAFIISEHHEEIAKEIMSKIPRGVTGINVTGKYTQENKEMLFVIVSQKEITKMRDLVKQIDEKAFVIITDVREVLGQGFIEDYTPSL